MNGNRRRRRQSKKNHDQKGEGVIGDVLSAIGSVLREFHLPSRALGAIGFPKASEWMRNQGYGKKSKKIKL